jgi:hypothetical protein
MSSTATNFGSFPHPVARSAAAPDAARSAPDSIFDAHSDRPLTVPATERGPVGSPWGAWLAGVRQAFDRWTESNAQSRADACVRDMARSDPRIMADLMHARSLDDSETLIEPVAAATTAPAAPALEAVPMVRQPHQRIAGQGWGRLIEDAYQHRFQHPRRQHG